MSRGLRVLGLVLVLSTSLVSLAAAQAIASTSAVTTEVAGLPFPIYGPAPPPEPETSSRDEQGRLTIRAVRVSQPLTIDGRLEESIYRTVPPVSGFIQNDPDAGAPSTQKTEFWIFYDDKNVYCVLRAYESEPSKMILTEMRRDSITITQNEYVNFVFDTFYDRRNAVAFVMTPTGARMDGQITNERQYNGDWNPVWNLRVGRFEGGWTAEAAIPFKSLRYRAGRTQVWGLHVSRYNRWKNEMTYLVPMPRARGTGGSFQMSIAPTVVGIEAPAIGRILEIKPYVISSVNSDLTATPRVSNDVTGDFGVDVKYGLTQGITADFTYNTDFAQVEADEQQINLTRFNLFFPEKREFFLENQGVFSFGGVAAVGNAAGAGDAPILFYSRRIGLNGARIVPLRAGGRLTGRAGPFSIGAIDIQSEGDTTSSTRSTNFSVVRVRRDLLRRSSVGALFSGRTVTQSGVGNNRTYGVDGTFAFFQNLAFNTYWARTQTTRRPGEDKSFRAQLDYAGDRYGVQVEQLNIGANFNPEIGFVRRSDIERSFGLFRFSPRPQHRFKSVRRFFVQGSLAYLENHAGRVELRNAEGEAAVEYQNSDRLAVNVSNFYEYIPGPFRIAPRVTVPVGGYDYHNVRLSYTFGQQRRLNGNVSVERGTLYNGTKTAFGVSRGRMKVTTQLSVEPTLSFNHVELPQGTFDTNLIGSRITFTPTPFMFVSALVQYNSLANLFSSNIRMRWEYTPGSELFVVYNDQRDTTPSGFPALTNRAFVVKVNRFLRF